MEPNGISTPHHYNQPLAFCLTYVSLPPSWTTTTSTLSGTIKPRFRWTSPISTLPSTCCPPHHLPFPTLIPFSLSSPHQSLPATSLSPSSSQHSLSPSPPFPPICCTPPLRSLALSYQPPPPLSSCFSWCDCVWGRSCWQAWAGPITPGAEQWGEYCKA